MVLSYTLPDDVLEASLNQRTQEAAPHHTHFSPRHRPLYDSMQMAKKEAFRSMMLLPPDIRGHLALNGVSSCHRSVVQLPKWLRGEESTCNTGDEGSIPGSGRSPGEGNGNPLQHSCLENPMDRGT